MLPATLLQARRLLRPRIHLHQRRFLFNFPGPLQGSDGKPSLFLNMVMAMPLCGAWYYFRVHIMEDWKPWVRQKKDEASSGAGIPDRTAEIVLGAEAVVAVAAAAVAANDVAAATTTAAAAAATVASAAAAEKELVKSSKSRGWAFWR